MGYDRQRSPFGTRVLLTCYFLFLLVNVLLYANRVSRMQKETFHTKYEFELIFLVVLSMTIFCIGFYGLWFARIIILCFLVFFFSMLLGASLISFILLVANLLAIQPNVFVSLSNSLYFAHNYMILVTLAKSLRYEIGLTVSCLWNILALWGTCHLCSCIEHRQDSWPYRKRTHRLSQTIL
ncbi:unnamed protein product [Adineta ricciae]|uniref:Uncharacterized protein n=1 Tax=Adineta ricciae TaxID=249248 RepID=A0A814MED6_ADIRI|nr:unnamed protein product [Adineta ricciae]CAF1078215.1 unnamed protein product [Adineta ricciae]